MSTAGPWLVRLGKVRGEGAYVTDRARPESLAAAVAVAIVRRERER